MAPVVDELQRLRIPLQCWHESLVSARTDPLVALSVDGAVIATDRPVPVGTPLFLELSSSDEAPGAEVDAVAIDGGGDEKGFAVRFVALDNAARRFIAARLAEEERAAAPDATLVPQEVQIAPAGSATVEEPHEAPLQKPAARGPVVPLELSLDDAAAAPLSVDDLASLVPEAEAPSRLDAIELELGDTDEPAPLPVAEEVVSLPSSPRPAATEEEAPLAAVAPRPPPRSVEEAPLPVAAAAPRSPPPAASPPAAVPPPPARPLVMPAAVRTDAVTSARGPAPVPETEQTIKWARASLVAQAPSSSGAGRNPFATGDSGSRPALATPEQPERMAPLPEPRPQPPSSPTPAASFLDAGPEQVERTERWLRPALPSAPTPAPERADLEETRPWTRANLLASSPPPPPTPPRARTPTSPLTPAAGLPSPMLAQSDPGSLPRAPMPRIASMEVPGSAPTPAVEQTQRWPTAKVRVANAPLEMPVIDVPFSQPPEMQEQGELGAGLDVLFGTDEPLGVGPPAFPPPMIDRRLEVEPALETPIEIDESFEPEPSAPSPPAPSMGAAAPDDTLPLATRLSPASTSAPSFDTTLPLGTRAPLPSQSAALDATLPLGTRLPPPAPRASPPAAAVSLDDTQPLPAAPGASPSRSTASFALRDETQPLPAAPGLPAATFGHSGGLLGADDDAAFGGNAGDVFGGIEITDPGSERRVPATAEDGFEAPDDIGPTLEAAEPIEVGEPIELTALDEEEAEPAVSAPPTPSAPPQVAPSFDVHETKDGPEAIVTAEIPAETQERLLRAALSRPAEPAVRTPAAPSPPEAAASAAPAAAPAAASTTGSTSGAAAQVRTDPFYDRPSAEGVPFPPRPEPKPTETQPYFTLGSLAQTLPPLPPPPPAMTRPPPLPSAAASPPARPAAPSSMPPPASSDAPQRTDPFFPRWSEAAGATPPSSNPFAGLTPKAPVSAMAPLLSNAVSAAQAPAAPEGGDTFFDDLAFQVAEQPRSALPAPAEQWQVEPQHAPEELPTVVGTDDLPTVVGRAATPSTANPWLVGEPAKKA